MDIKENTFAEACFNNNSIENLKTALANGPDEADMKVWGISESEWTENVSLAIAALNEDSDAEQDLSEKLTAKMRDYFNKAVCSKTAVFDNDIIGQAFGDILHEFMKDEFDVEYEDDEEAMEFYTEKGCDIRSDFERESTEKRAEIDLEILTGEINEAESLPALRDALNALEIHFAAINSELRVEDYIDLTSLPQFDNDKTEGVDGSFSCDLESHMFYNDCAGDVVGRVGWEIQPISDFDPK